MPGMYWTVFLYSLSVCVVRVSSIDVVCCLFLSTRNHSSYSQTRLSVARRTKTRHIVLEESFSLQQLSWEWLPLLGSLLCEGHDLLYCHVFPHFLHTLTQTHRLHRTSSLVHAEQPHNRMHSHKHTDCTILPPAQSKHSTQQNTFTQTRSVHMHVSVVKHCMCVCVWELFNMLGYNGVIVHKHSSSLSYATNYNVLCTCTEPVCHAWTGLDWSVRFVRANPLTTRNREGEHYSTV